MLIIHVVFFFTRNMFVNSGQCKKAMQTNRLYLVAHFCQIIDHTTTKSLFVQNLQ